MESLKDKFRNHKTVAELPLLAQNINHLNGPTAPATWSQKIRSIIGLSPYILHHTPYTLNPNP
jgi:hypothetical protein